MEITILYTKLKTIRNELVAIPNQMRPTYYCDECDISFPSILDLEEHKKIDHGKKVSAAA